MAVPTQLAERILREEDKRLKLYKDSKGILTIGVGYNIEEKGLPEDIVDELFHRTLEEATQDAERIPEYRMLDAVRKTVLVAMVYQMGLGRVMAFQRMRAAIRDRHFSIAASEMLDSVWAREDSPARAKREAEIMRTGKFS